MICGAADFAAHSHDLDNLPIRTPSGQTVRLSAVADVLLSRGPEQVNHSERQRSITIQLTPAPGDSAGSCHGEDERECAEGADGESAISEWFVPDATGGYCGQAGGYVV